MILVLNTFVAVALVSAAAGAIVFLRRNTLLAVALTSSLLIVAAYAVLNVLAVEQAVHGIIPSGASLVKHILLASVLSVFAVATKAIGGRWGAFGVVGWPLCVVVAQIGSWLDARQWCNAADDISFSECAGGVLPYGISEVVVLGSLTVYGAQLLRHMIPSASRRTAAGRAVAALCFGLSAIVCWSVVAIWGTGEAFYLGHLSDAQKFFRRILSITAVAGLVVGMFIMPVSTVRQQVHLRRVAGPVGKRLDELAGVERARGVPLVTHMMDQFGAALRNDGGVVTRDAAEGEKDAALWLLGRGDCPTTVPMKADPERQANWLIRVATIMKNETRKSG